MDAMRRAIRSLVLCGVLGTLTTFVVGWAISLASQHDRSQNSMFEAAESKCSDGAGYYDWKVCSMRGPGWEAFTSSWDRDRPVWVSRVEFGAFDPHVPGWAEILDPRRYASVGSEEVHYGSAETAGWPMLAVRGATVTRSRYPDPETEPEQIVKNGMFTVLKLIPLRKTCAGALTFENSASDTYLLPWHPIWPGFFVNTALYSAILWALFFAPGAIRRGHRRRRGACVRCGYDLRGDGNPCVGTACPECGAESLAPDGG
jgi:hypothetical protein